MIAIKDEPMGRYAVNQKKRILSVDDDYRTTKVVRMILEAAGYAVRTETDADRAHASAVEFKPDLILLDVSMPDKDGGEVAQELRSSPETKDIPIVFLTGMVSEDEIIGKLGFLGGEEYIPKPVQPSTLLFRVRNRLNNRNVNTISL